jgi:hypothetical protein
VLPKNTYHERSGKYNHFNVSRKPHVLALEKGFCGRGGVFGDDINYVGEVVGRDVSGPTSLIVVVVYLWLFSWG